MISSKGTWASWFSAHCLHFIFALLGSMTILPTVLFLVTGVLKETAVKTPDNSVPVPVAAALQSIKTIFTSPIARMESVQTQWTSLVRSSLASVLEYSQPGELIHTHSLSDSDFLSFCGAEICLALPVYKKKSTTSLLIKSMFVWFFLDESRPDMDEVSMLTAITLFLLSASSELVGVTVLQKGCMDHFRNALNSSDPWVSSHVHKQRCNKRILNTEPNHLFLNVYLWTFLDII